MKKIDYKKEFKQFYSPPASRVVAVDLPAFQFLMVDGQGDPNSSKAYADAIETLFSLSYTLKFMMKKGSAEIDYGVMPLESLWWVDDMARFAEADKSEWKWTAMIMQPSVITREAVAAAMADVEKKKNPAALHLARLESFAEGSCAQILHVGPFSEEGPTIERVHAFIAASGRTRRGRHHEIYLSDIRRADPAKWRTIVRQPMR